MAESKRLPLSQQDEAALRARQIDALLDEGLERYFAAHYEEAIHLWTRVLFLDHSHARARAYIERARTAMAELQRRSDELLQASRELLEQGETEAARQLLSEAVSTSGDDVQASALRVRLERLERVRALGDASPSPADRSGPPARWFWRSGQWQGLGLGLAVILVIGVVAILVQGSGDPKETSAVAAAPAPVAGHVPVLSSSEVALVRARTSMARGQLSEALRELDRVGLDSPIRTEADQLRIEIQQLLMANVRSSSVTTLTEPVRR